MRSGRRRRRTRGSGRKRRRRGSGRRGEEEKILEI